MYIFFKSHFFFNINIYIFESNINIFFLHKNLNIVTTLFSHKNMDVTCGFYVWNSFYIRGKYNILDTLNIISHTMAESAITPSELHKNWPI